MRNPFIFFFFVLIFSCKSEVCKNLRNSADTNFRFFESDAYVHHPRYIDSISGEIKNDFDSVKFNFYSYNDNCENIELMFIERLSMELLGMDTINLNKYRAEFQLIDVDITLDEYEIDTSFSMKNWLLFDRTDDGEFVGQYSIFFKRKWPDITVNTGYPENLEFTNGEFRAYVKL